MTTLDTIERRLDEMRSSLEHRIDNDKAALEHRIEAKETLRAGIRAVHARLGTLENPIRDFMQQVSVEASLYERVASLEARMPRQ